MLSLCLPACFLTTEAFLFRSTLVEEVREEERVGNKVIFLVAFCKVIRLSMFLFQVPQG